MNLLVFFDFEPKKCFRVPALWGLYGAEWDESRPEGVATPGIGGICPLEWANEAGGGGQIERKRPN